MREILRCALDDGVPTLFRHSEWGLRRGLWGTKNLTRDGNDTYCFFSSFLNMMRDSSLRSEYGAREEGCALYFLFCHSEWRLR